MSLFCTCPAGTEITDITIPTCPEDLGQIQKIVFQRVFASAGTKNFVVIGTNNPNLLATWTTLLAAADSTKVVQTPFIENPNNEAGEKREYGGGNLTLNGIPINMGSNPSPFTAEFLRVPQETIKEIKTMRCETVGVYLITENGQIVGISDDSASPVNFYPIPIDGLHVSDKKFGNYEEVDKNMIEWMFRPNWSDNLHVVTPSDFDALTELVTP